MAGETTTSTGRIIKPWWSGAFVMPALPQRCCSGAALSQRPLQQRLKCRRRRRTSSDGSSGRGDPLHAMPPPRSCSAPNAEPPRPGDNGTAQRLRLAARWTASPNGGALSAAAAPQALSDPPPGATKVRCTAEETRDGTCGSSNSSVGGSSSGLGSRGNRNSTDGCRCGDGDAARMGGEVRDVSALGRSKGRQQGFLVEEAERTAGGGGAKLADEAELGTVRDGYSRQLIVGLAKLARAGLWKASFKVLRVEQALVARKRAAAREDGEVYPNSSWLIVEALAYNTILAALSKAGKWQEAVLLMKEMETRGVRRDAVSYASLIAACGRGLQWKKALSALEEMRFAGIEANSFVYSAAIDACAKGSQWQRALLLLQEMEVVDGLPANLICYNAAVIACGKAGRPGEAIALLRKMRKTGIDPDEVSYLSAITACSRGGDWQQALRLLDEMKVFGLRPDLKCYCSAITACGNGGKWREALLLLDTMHREGPPPNDYCYNAAISACGKSGQWRRSQDLLVTMRERGVRPDRVTFNAAIDACARSGRWREGINLFVDMAKASEAPWDPWMDETKPPTPDATTYGAVITACSKGKQWQMAIRFLDDMEKKGVERTEGVFQATLACCARMGRWRECIIILDQMQKSRLTPRVAAYNSVVTACGRAGEWQRAIAILRQMFSRGTTPDVITLNATMTACVQSKRLTHAKAILDFMRDPTSVPTVEETGGLTFPVLDLEGTTAASAATASSAAALATTIASRHKLLAASSRVVAAEGRNGGTSAGTCSGVGSVVGATPVAFVVETPVAEARVGGASFGGCLCDPPAAVAAPAAWSTRTSSGRSRMSGGPSASLQRRTREGVRWPPRPDAYSFHTVIKAFAAAGMWQDAVAMLEGMADEMQRHLRGEEEVLMHGPAFSAKGVGRWPVDVDRFRRVFQLEIRNNEIVGHERGRMLSSGPSGPSPEVALRVKAMDVLAEIEREDKEARLRRQALSVASPRR